MQLYLYPKKQREMAISGDGAARILSALGSESHWWHTEVHLRQPGDHCGVDPAIQELTEGLVALRLQVMKRLQA
jgi:hypothetical protein